VSRTGSSSTSAPKLSFSANALVSGHHVSLHATCAVSECDGTAEIVERIVVHRGRTLAHATVVLARGSFRLAAGGHGSIRLRLTSAGIEHLSHAARQEVSGRLNYALRGDHPGAQQVTVR
jgi:hypothetical protein